NILGLDKGGLLSLITIGVLHGGIAYCMYFSSIKNLRGTQVALLSYIDPLVAVIISFVFLNERISTLQAIGGFMILLATFINEKLTTKTRA
ncbi:MAG: DMT family transporter, partial [Clostridia bacterium]|nr:DMT family transporter [Clostridia bacterium]